MRKKKTCRYQLEGLYQLDCLPTEKICESWIWEDESNDLAYIQRLEKRAHSRGILTRRTVLEL